VAVEHRFVGRVVSWRGPAPYVYVTVPADVSADIDVVRAEVSYGWGAVPVEARIAGVTFTTSLFPKDGRYLLPLKVVVRTALGVELDDEVDVELVLRPAHHGRR
jgi:hypothetical protein